MTEPGLPFEEILIQECGLEAVMFCLTTLHDTNHFLANPLLEEFFRPAFPVEVERLFPGEVDINSDNFRVRVIMINLDMHQRDFFQRQHGKLIRIGTGFAGAPTENALRVLQKIREGADGN